MSVMPIGAITQAASPLPTTPSTSGTSGSGSGFGDLITKALDEVQSTQSTADQMAQQAATGQLTNVHDLTIATSEAQLAVQLTTAVRDKAVSAFTAIMQMPV